MMKGGSSIDVKFIDFKYSSDNDDDGNPYSVCDGKWGGMGSQCWYRGKDTGDVLEINGGLEELEIVKVWRNREQKWDRNILPTDYGQLRREINIYNINCYRQKEREFIESEKALGHRFPRYFHRIIAPKIDKDLSKLKEYDYDIRKVLMKI